MYFSFKPVPRLHEWGSFGCDRPNDNVGNELYHVRWILHHFLEKVRLQKLEV